VPSSSPRNCSPNPSRAPEPSPSGRGSEYGESVAAVTEPREGAIPDPDAIRDYLGDRLAGFKVPRVIEFDDNLPREESGKVFNRYWPANQAI
jgi:acyl-CoA synthetase (AMP-forming)/AMP-acid ligase II